MNNLIKPELQISVHRLKIGMYISRLDKSWQDSSFLDTGFLIENNKQILQLMQECEYVYINTLNTPPDLYQVEQEKPRKKPLKLAGLFNLLSIEMDKPALVGEQISVTKVDEAKETLGQATQFVDEIIEQLKTDGKIDMAIAEKSIRHCIQTAFKSSDAMLLIYHLNLKHHSVLQHSINVGILAIQLGLYLKLDEKALVFLGLSGLFHDIGSLLVSEEMLDHTESQIEMMPSHTILGRDILLSSPSPWSETVAEVAYTHHEYLNGTGFPQGLHGDEISTYTRMITIIDLYDNLTNAPSKEQSLTHLQAIEELQKQQDIHIDAELLESFSQCLGVYPVGSIVELNTGERAIVMEENLLNKLKPKVNLLSATGELEAFSRVIDLANDDFDSPDCLYEIKGIISNSMN